MLILGSESVVRRLIKPRETSILAMFSFNDHRGNCFGREKDLRHPMAVETGTDILARLALDFSDIRETVVSIAHDCGGS